jgi:hypothetical protein
MLYIKTVVYCYLLTLLLQLRINSTPKWSGVLGCSEFVQKRLGIINIRLTSISLFIRYPQAEKNIARDREYFELM